MSYPTACAAQVCFGNGKEGTGNLLIGPWGWISRETFAARSISGAPTLATLHAQLQRTMPQA